MTTERARRISTSLLLALLVNGLGLYLMIQINRLVHTPAEKSRSEVKSLILQEPPKKKHRRSFQQQVVRTRPRSVPLAVPDLPSSISSEQLHLPELGAVDLFGQLLGRHQDLGADLILTEEAVDEPPRVISRVAAEYPGAAEDRGVEGHVVFKLQVSATGKVEKAWVLESDPPGVFEAAAERAVRRYRFSPARFRGRTVPVLCRHKIVFTLED